MALLVIWCFGFAAVQREPPVADSVQVPETGVADAPLDDTPWHLAVPERFGPLPDDSLRHAIAITVRHEPQTELDLQLRRERSTDYLRASHSPAGTGSDNWIIGTIGQLTRALVPAGSRPGTSLQPSTDRSDDSRSSGSQSVVHSTARPLNNRSLLQRAETILFRFSAIRFPGDDSDISGQSDLAGLRDHSRADRGDGLSLGYTEDIVEIRISPLEELIGIESRIAAMLPRVQKAMVSVDGGSGFLVSPEGIVITVAHVTKTAGRRVTVLFADGSTASGTTLGSNKSTDLGAIRLDGNGPWPYLELSDPAILQPGDWCVALGYPITIPREGPPAVRTGRVIESSDNRIVTDCVILGGDSGGPLLDPDGRVLGVSIGVTTSVNRNIHMPVDRFVEDSRTILAGIDLVPRGNGSVTFLGVRGVTDDRSVRIRSVNEGSPAQIAGLRADDVILGINGRPVASFPEMVSLIREHDDGDVVLARLNRFGRILEVPVELRKHRGAQR